MQQTAIGGWSEECGGLAIGSDTQQTKQCATNLKTRSVCVTITVTCIIFSYRNPGTQQMIEQYATDGKTHTICAEQ